MTVTITTIPAHPSLLPADETEVATEPRTTTRLTIITGGGESVQAAEGSTSRPTLRIA